MDARAELGSFLQIQRQRRGVLLDDLAAATKIPSRSLERLEAGQWDALPAPVFVRGFVRACGRELGVEAEAMEHFERALLNCRRLPAGGPQPTREAPLEDQTPRRFGLALVVIIVLIIVSITVSMVWSAGPQASRRAAIGAGGGPEVLRGAPEAGKQSTC